MDEMGIDRILFAIDWPFVANKPATDWMDTIAALATRTRSRSERQREEAVADVSHPLPEGEGGLGAERRAGVRGYALRS